MPTAERKKWTDEERIAALKLAEEALGEAPWSAGLIRAKDENLQENNEKAFTFMFNEAFGTDMDPTAISRSLAQFKKALTPSPLCSYPGCNTERSKRGKGFCVSHYKQWKQGKVKDADQYPAKGGAEAKPAPPTPEPPAQKPVKTRKVKPASKPGPIKKRTVRKGKVVRPSKDAPIYILAESNGAKSFTDPMVTTDLDELAKALEPEDIEAIRAGTIEIWQVSRVAVVKQITIPLG